MKYLVEIEIRGPLGRELRAADTVGGCQLVERAVRNGFLNGWPDKYLTRELFLTVRAMEHVTIPKALFVTGLASDSGRSDEHRRR